MRCPKCQYISFDDSTRCRNCGYEFSLSEPDTPLDLPIKRTNEPIGPLADLRLGSAPAAPLASSAHADAGPPSARRTVTPDRLDLPLFNEDAPLVSARAVPRVPLGVRRAAPAVRPRPAEPRPEEADLQFPEGSSRGRLPRRAQANEPSEEATAGAGRAPAGLRMAGAAIDGLILGSIDAAVLSFTLQLCGLTFREVAALPPVPIAAFLLLLNGGYLTIFTAAGGQTIGKMIAGTRVVASSAGDGPARVPFGAAFVRACASLLSILPAGAGFFMALFRADGRALHDTLADTRVIRA